MSTLLRYAAFTSCLLAVSAGHGEDNGLDPEYDRLQGDWKIVELTDNGTSVPSDQFGAWLPAGGRFEVVDNTMIFTSPLDGKKSAKTFAVDPTAFPKRIAIVTGEKVEGVGIYKFDNERLIVCVANPLRAEQPEEFSAREGSNRMMMVLVRPTSAPGSDLSVKLPPPTRRVASKPAPSALPAPPTPPAPAPTPPAPTPTPPSAAAKVLTDAEVIAMLYGTWRLNDGTGLVDVTFEGNRTFRSFRETQNMSTFHQVFVQTPISSGTWNVQSGQLMLHVTASTYWDRVNKPMQFAVRSISPKDMIVVDYLGRVVRAVKLR